MQSIILDPSGKIKNLSRLKSKGDYLKGCTLFFSPRISHLIPEYGPLARLMGAKYVVNFEPEKCTHFIHSSRCRQEKFGDFLKAKENGVKIVSHAWIFECYQQGDHLDETQFPHTTEFYRKTSSLLKFDGQGTVKTRTDSVVSQNDQSASSNILNQDVNLEALPSSIENQNQNQVTINSDKPIQELSKEKNEMSGIVKLPPKVQDFIDNIEFHFKESHKKRAIFEAQEAREAEEERRRNMKASPIVEPIKIITKPIILEPLPPSQPIFYYNKEQELKKKELIDNMNRYYDKKEEAERKKREMEKEKENLKQVD
ncbi:hypothetical protein K502DRAFT_206529 [Neoconidiobolus thromboides FSU 785]|nr:hypothetical protein K502DRAFT_206529 [Neoconidiobolus thromboides FSU 785]